MTTLLSAVEYERRAAKELEAAAKVVSLHDRKGHLDQAAVYAYKSEQARR